MSCREPSRLAGKQTPPSHPRLPRASQLLGGLPAEWEEPRSRPPGQRLS